MQPALAVSTSAELLHALERLAPSDFVAIDTEFMRESTYYPKLCLIQIASADVCALIDPLTTTDLHPLWQFVADRARVKVLHAARQDLEVLSLANETLPGPIFDTQVAASLLGYSAQIGYGALVAERVGHTLPKDHTRTDWSRRPLSSEQLQYAADDVRYLAPLYADLRNALGSAGRLDWLYEDTAELERPDLHRTEPQEAWRRLKGLDRLKPEQRATAKLLAEWRESVAIRSNRPRGWILADDALRQIADQLPASVQELEGIRTLPPAVVRRRGEELVAIVERGRAAAGSEAAAATYVRPDSQQLAMVTKLMNYTRAQGEELKISPEMLATRRDVEQLVYSRRTGHLLEGWRRAVIGERLIELAGLPV